MRFIFKFNLLLQFFLFSTQLISMDAERDEKPTEFIFKAMEYYEQGNFEKAAAIFSRYAGKPIPVAEPFCRDLQQKGYLQPFDSIPSLEESDEGKNACLYFNAAQQFLKLKHEVDQKFSKNSKKMKGQKINEATLKQRMMRTACLKEVDKDSNCPLSYTIGCLYESENRETAKKYFMFALTNDNNLRSIFGLKRVCTDAQFKQISLNGISIVALYGAFNLMPVLHQDEGRVLASLSGYFPQLSGNKKIGFFLHAAAQFGHEGAQLLWGVEHCSSETQTLYWMMQCAGWNNLRALSLCGHMIEAGKGTPTNYEKAYTYLERAAHHPEARGIDFLNFGLVHEQIDKNQVACQWYKKANDASSDDQYIKFTYGHMLRKLDEYETAFPFLFATQNYSDEAMYEYGVVLTKLPPEKRDVQKAVSIFTGLASRGCIVSAGALVMLAVDKEIPYDNETLGIYKSYLEKAIDKEKLEKESKRRNERIANAYNTLRNLYFAARDLFVQCDFHATDLSVKAYLFNLDHQPFQMAYASDLEKSGQYEQALYHLLLLEKAKYPVSHNYIGYCYEKLANESASEKKREEFIDLALRYYRQELENEQSSQRATAAFNIYNLSRQKRINPLPDEELVALLKIAADGGDEDASNDLGVAYWVGGFGLGPDLAQAEYYLRKAIEKECWLAKLNLMNLKLSQVSEEAKEDAKRLSDELWEKYPEEFGDYIQSLIIKVKSVLNAPEDEILEDDIYPSQTEEKEPTAYGFLETLNPSSSTEDTEYLKETEEFTPQPVQTTIPVQHQENQGIAPVLSKREMAEREEKERLQRKYDRMMKKVEDLRGKKQTKYRKIQTLISQHINNFSGAIKNSKGSGRRVQIGDTHSGFHQPHSADMKGGALKSMINAMNSGMVPNTNSDVLKLLPK